MNPRQITSLGAIHEPEDPTLLYGQSHHMSQYLTDDTFEPHGNESMLLMRAFRHSMKYLKRLSRIATCGRSRKYLDEVLTAHRFAHDVMGSLNRYNQIMNRPVSSSSSEEGEDLQEADADDRPYDLPPPPPTQKSQLDDDVQPETSRPAKIRAVRGRGRERGGPSLPRWRS